LSAKTYQVSVGSAQSPAELARAGEIRHTVFVLEQGVPVSVEVDGKDAEARHFLARLGPSTVATARLRLTEKGHKLERVAVLREHRGQGVGLALVRYVISTLPPRSALYVHAQHTALAFWQRLGFVAEGPTFVEGGIDHRYMTLHSTA
jgi:predicted GNAT family N-acyltransferase